MEFIEANPWPKACRECDDIKTCRARGEGEWCCDECDYLGERFIMVTTGPDAGSARRISLDRTGRRGLQ